MIDELNQFPKCRGEAEIERSIQPGMIVASFADLNELHSTGEVIDNCLPAAPMPPLDGEVILSAGDNDPVRRRSASPLGDQWRCCQFLRRQVNVAAEFRGLDG